MSLRSTGCQCVTDERVVDDFLKPVVDRGGSGKRDEQVNIDEHLLGGFFLEIIDPNLDGYLKIAEKKATAMPEFRMEQWCVHERSFLSQPIDILS